MKKKIIFTSVAAGLLSLGVVIGWVVTVQIQSSQSEKYPLLSKRIFNEDPNDIRLGFSQLRTKLYNYVNSQLDSDNNINIYFEYLPTGSSIRVNDAQRSIGASLIKVPLAMNIYKLIEQGKIDPNQTVTILPEMLDSGYGELYKQGAGQTLTVEQLLQVMLVQSDNTATSALWSVYEEAQIAFDDNVVNYLDLEFSNTDDSLIAIGARQYSTILKCLYFACYNSVENSHHILDLLTQTEYNNRLRRYLQDEPVVIAHKIGTFQEDYQSDCGIFYIDKNNYILCVMIEGEDAEASLRIGELSNIVYRHMEGLIVEDANIR
jgi:beta-lactamase class A